MVIRKLYRIESAHIVLDAISRRCSHSTHGHSGVIEVFLKSNKLDNAGMVYDFGALKNTIGSFIDMFDHSVHLYSKDCEERIEFFKKMNERYILLPCNPTAENYALLFKGCINEILLLSNFTNGEGNIYCSGVRYHETVTGYAESEEDDKQPYGLKDTVFSEQTLKEASAEMRAILEEAKKLG